MQKSFDLPAPPADALEISNRLGRLIRDRIDAAGGWISFAAYMDLALYAPGLGYYSAGSRKFGAAGDFVTAPELSPYFAASLARVADETLAACGGGEVLEIGAGTGRMAADMLTAMRRPPSRYRILEVSAQLRERQRRTLADRAPRLADRVEWLDQWPAEPVTGLVLANEVLDALPVERFVVEQGRVHALGVAAAPGGFCWASRPAPPAMLARVGDIAASLGRDWPPAYVSEYCPMLPGWIRGLGEALGHGLALLIDYGLPRREFYHPQRDGGTLNCHYRHRVHDDPFLWPGLQDLTAWVDFTAVAEAAAGTGMELAVYTTQAQFLLAAGISELAGHSGGDALRIARDAAGLRQLLLPGEMGERFKVMAFTRGLARPPASVAGRDLRDRL